MRGATGRVCADFRRANCLRGCFSRTPSVPYSVRGAGGYGNVSTSTDRTTFPCYHEGQLVILAIHSTFKLTQSFAHVAGHLDGVAGRRSV
jgi:hypothetical protein